MTRVLRVRLARCKKGICSMIRKWAKEIAAGVMEMLFIASVACLIGIGFGIGLAVAYVWIF